MAKIDLDLPSAPAPRRGIAMAAIVSIIVSSITLVLVAYVAFRPAGPAGGAPPGSGDAAVSLDGERLLTLADRLERRTLFAAAADILGAYVEATRPEGEDLGKVLYRRARDLMLAGRHEDAARIFMEADAHGLPPEEERRAEQLLLDCYTALGKHAVREDAARALAEYGREEQGGPVATLTGETISAGELLLALGQVVRAELAPQAFALPREEFEKLARAEIHKRLGDEKALTALAEELLRERVLFREALERKLDDDPEVPQEVERFRRAALANRVIRDAILDLQITALDVETYFGANRESYAIPEAVRIAAARFDDRAAADAARKGGEIPFEPVEGWVERRGEIPGIGRSPEVEAHLFALEPATVSDRPIEAAGAFHLFRVEEKRERRIPELAEARARVEADLVAAKRREAVLRLQAQLSAKFGARIEEDAIRKLAGKAAKTESEEGQ